MPYKSEKVKIEKTKYDKRVKLTPEKKVEIKEMYERGGISQRELAKKFGVSRRLIVFCIHPEKLEANYQRRVERGGSKFYYDRLKHNEYMKTHRQHKQKLFIEGKIKLNEE